MRWNIQWSIVVVCLMFGAGCGAPKPMGDTLKGTVTLDGQPLAKGRVNLVPTDGIGSSAGSEIVDGKFEMRIHSGPKLVEITSDKVTGKQKAYPDDPASPEFDIVTQILPAKYNSKTELKVDVKIGEPTEATFALESEKRAK